MLQYACQIFSTILLYVPDNSLYKGIPHLDQECNDTVLLGFMIAQFVAEFNYQEEIKSLTESDCFLNGKF